MSGKISIIRDKWQNILIRLYLNETGTEYYEVSLTPDQAVEYSSDILQKAILAKYFIKHPVRD